MKLFKCSISVLVCLSLLIGIGYKSKEENLNEKPQMIKKEISFRSIDDIINTLKATYQSNGLQGVKEWAVSTFQSNMQISVARDVTNISNIDTEFIYDRAIIKLNESGEEMGAYYLKPMHEDAFSSNLFLSVRLNFIDDPLELLIYTK